MHQKTRTIQNQRICAPLSGRLLVAQSGAFGEFKKGGGPWVQEVVDAKPRGNFRILFFLGEPKEYREGKQLTEKEASTSGRANESFCGPGEPMFFQSGVAIISKSFLGRFYRVVLFTVWHLVDYRLRQACCSGRKRAPRKPTDFAHAVAPVRERSRRVIFLGGQEDCRDFCRQSKVGVFRTSSLGFVARGVL